MSRLCVAPIVEGHGDDAAVRILLDRIWREIVGGEYIEVLKPIRRKRQKLAQQSHELSRSIELAVLKLKNGPGLDPSAVLLLIDADDDCPAQIAPQLIQWAQTYQGHVDFMCVIANREFESWFVASAESLIEYLEFDAGELPADAEATNKSWVASHFKGTRYSETVDQPAMTAAMNLELCRQRAPSFDKLCRELEKRRGKAV